MLKILPIPIAPDIVDISVDQLLGDGARDIAVADGNAVYITDGTDAETGRRDKDLCRVHRIIEIDIRFFDRQVLFPGEVYSSLTAHTRENVALFWRENYTVLHNKDITAFAFREIPVCVQ